MLSERSSGAKQQTAAGRLALIIGTLGPGGAERVLSILANLWAERGVEVTIITLNGSNVSFYALHPSIRCLTIVHPVAEPGAFRSMRLLVSMLRHIWQLRRIIKTVNPDSVLSFIDASNVVTLAALLGTRYARVVAERADPAMVPLSMFWRILRRSLYWTADCVVVQTARAALFFRHSFVRRIEVVPNPVPPAVAVGAGQAIPRPCIVSVGRFAEQKRFNDLIDAFALISRAHPEWSLVIVGDGPLRPNLEKQIADLGLSDRVLLSGIVQSPTQIVAQADIFVLSSRFEGFPNALCEAMALGRAVIATDCPSGPREIIRDNIDGVLVPPLAPQTLAQALERLISSPRERERLGAAAASIVDRFKPEAILFLWESILDASIKGRKTRIRA